jgi:hypothetical protein
LVCGPFSAHKRLGEKTLQAALMPLQDPHSMKALAEAHLSPFELLYLLINVPVDNNNNIKRNKNNTA